MGTMCDNFIIYEDNQNEFKMWQGLVGAHYTPYVDSIGNLSWTNNGGLPNPPTVNIAGKGLNIVGIVDEDTDLPETANNFDTYLVGTEDPYSAYIYDNGTWYNLGIIGQGEKGDPGDGVPTGGTTGQVLAKASSSDYDTEWKTPDPGVDPATADPLMDGTAAVGTSTKYAREDHVHPSDTSRAPETLEAGIAIIVDGDTCTQSVAKGAFAYIKNNTHGLAEGLYRNTSSSTFPTSGGTANSTVFTAVSNGGLNSVLDDFAVTEYALSSSKISYSDSVTKPIRVTGNVVELYVNGTMSESVNGWDIIATFPGNLGPKQAMFSPLIEPSGAYLQIAHEGMILISTSIAANASIRGSLTIWIKK